MISMGKSGGVYGSGNTGLPQAFSGGKKTQNNQKSIFGAKNKSSVTDIRRMLSRNSQSTQTQAANSWGQDSIVTSSLSYSESLRNQRQQTKNTTLALKKLKYQFKNISSKILRSKTSQAAKQAAGQARREIMRLKRQKQNSDSDSDSEEIDAAIAHAQAMERVAKKKAKHLEEEEMMKAAGGICQGDRISEEETKDVPDAEAENARNAEEMSAEDSANEVSGDFSAYEYAGDSYDISDYVDLGMDEFYAQAGDFMSEMSDFTSEMMQEMSDSLRDLMEEMGLDGLSDTAVSVDREMDPADLKMMKIKHRNKEMKDIVKADAEYLKAVFDHLEKMKDNAVIPTGNTGAVSAGMTGTSFSADVAGVGVPAAPVPVDRYLLEKEQIGAIAVAMIEPNDTVFLGNGTTCLQVAKNLRDRPNIRVVSNNIGVIAELLSAENCRLMVPGGELERAGASACLSGRHALRNISKLYFQKCFISVAAADLNAGYMVDTEDEAELYQILMQHSEQTTLLLDYSKFGQRALVPLCPLHEIRTVISNIQMPEAYKSYYFDHGVTVFTTIKDL